MSVTTKVAAVTLMGRKHRQRGIPCEDNSMAVERNGVSVVVVSDGAGGKAYTHARIGSQCVCEAITNLFCDHFDAIYSENREAAVRALIVAAVHSRMADAIKELKLDSLERLSATMLFCAVKDRRMMVGHIGDGLVVRISPSGISPITMPQNGTEASSTYFVTVPHAADYLRFIKTTVDDTHAVALMTDGVEGSVYDEASGLIRPVVGRMAETLSAGRKAAEQEIASILDKYVVGAGNTTDDASFGVMYFDNTKAPDFGAIPSKAEPFVKSGETFKDLQTSMVPDVKRAREIIADAVSNPSPESKAGDDVSITAKTGSSKPAEKETEDVLSKPSMQMVNRNLMIVLIFLCLVIIGLLVVLWLF